MGILTFARRGDATGDLNVEDQLKQLEIFSKLTDKQIRKLASLCVLKRYPKGEVFIRKGDTGLGMFLIVSGRVEVFDTREGSRVTLATLDSGKVVGEMSLMDARPRSAYAEAMEDTECLLITRDSFNNLTRRDAEILWGMVPLLVDRLRNANARLAELDEAEARRLPATVVAVETAPAAAADAPAVTVTVESEAGAETSVKEKKSRRVKVEVKDERDEDDDDDDDEDIDDEADEDDDDKDGTLLKSMTQVATASFLLVSSSMLLGAQESLRFVWSKDSMRRSLGKNEETVSSITSHVEERMNEETKRLFTEFQDLMSSVMRVFER